ncbi:type II toxin-antitoxin system HicB family antitoxin [Streptosporangium saharense]|uniref:Putative RNase H-like HicB family nuclease n=1 Tax=Streptosporangium saharense TaxID=1706840 RepID=A0A7W7VK71_9ACTN|nr:type II toxin-antitoxin system HicB family antitoxin [Streptosporangium saharense]MBB4913392.1 putative RNase H-like HicB family nuclease [Streptosporangium saharense]
MRKVTVVYHHEDNIWWAESTEPDLQTFAATGGTLDEVRELAKEGIAFYLDNAEIELDERYDQDRPVVVHFLMRSATGIADALTVSAGLGRSNDVVSPHPRLLTC